MKKSELFILWTGCLALVAMLLPVSSQGAATGDVINVTADVANSTAGAYGTSIGNLLTDTFLYNAVNPTATSPIRAWGTAPGGGTTAFHANEGDGSSVVLSFILDTPFTNTTSSADVVVDIWGRSDCCTDRDDDIDIILYDGDYSTVVAIIEGVAVPAADPQHARAIFDLLGVGEVFDRFQIIGHNSTAGTSNPFTLFEVRLAEVIPYTWTGNAGDGDWSNTVNWVAGAVPVDGAPGTGNFVGLTLDYRDLVYFDGTDLPSTNFPGIGGYYAASGRDTPSMVFNRGGTGTLDIVAINGGFWIDPVVSRYVIQVGDGIGGGIEDVDLTLDGPATINLNRHVGGSTQSVLVNSDGKLTFDSNLLFSYHSSRYGTVDIDGGDVVVNGNIDLISDIPQNYVQFLSTGGTFTANYGGDYGNAGNVRNRCDEDFVVGPALENYHLKVTPSGSSYTVAPGVYCWTGEANDGDWTNTANWVAGMVPVDNASGGGNLDGLTLAFNEFIVFDGTNMPSLNVPQFGGDHQSNANATPQKDTPTLRLKRGGAFTMSITGRDDGFWTNTQVNRTVLVVGDGVSGGIEDVTLTIANMGGSLNRHYGGITHTIEVNADGALIIDGNADSGAADRWSKFVLNGGSVVVLGTMVDITISVNNTVEFNSIDSSFKADFGGVFPDLATVKSFIGVNFIDNLSPEGMRLAAVYSGGNTFTVQYEEIPPMGTLMLLQ